MCYFLIKSIYYFGYSPDLDSCCICGNVSGPFYFKFHGGQITYTNCTNEGFYLEPELVNFYRCLELDLFKEIKGINLEKIILISLMHFLKDGLNAFLKENLMGLY